jgi:multidrug efflux pump subunit AcrB
LAEQSAMNIDSTKLEIYKLAVEMADRISARRAGANTFFSTLHGTLAVLVGFVSSARTPSPLGKVIAPDAFGLVVAAAAGIVLSFTWLLLLRYYRRLNSAKFRVINELEIELPSRPYTEEWSLLHPGELETQNPPTRGRLRRWLTRTAHREASAVEQIVPWVFVLIYLVLGVRAVSL